MKALIIGASSGIGINISRELAKIGYDFSIISKFSYKIQELKNK